jgi:hypothetical protein
VIVLMKEQGCSRSRAVETVTDLHNHDMRAFLSLADEVLERGLSRYANRSTFVRCLSTWMRGNYDWGNMTYRYNQSSG